MKGHRSGLTGLWARRHLGQLGKDMVELLTEEPTGVPWLGGSLRGRKVVAHAGTKDKTDGEGAGSAGSMVTRLFCYEHRDWGTHRHND